MMISLRGCEGWWRRIRSAQADEAAAGTRGRTRGGGTGLMRPRSSERPTPFVEHSPHVRPGHRQREALVRERLRQVRTRHVTDFTAGACPLARDDSPGTGPVGTRDIPAWLARVRAG